MKKNHNHTLETRVYTIEHDFGYSPYFARDKWRALKHLFVYVYVVRNYNDNNKLHTFHNCRHVWAADEVNRKTIASAKRARQVEKWCRLTGAKREIQVEVI